MLNARQLEVLVEEYFAGVDAKDWPRLQQVLAPDCSLRIQTHQVERLGRDQALFSVFESLFRRYDSIWHGNFRHIPDPDQQRIASQFQVLNTLADGTQYSKSNCNFFTVRKGLIVEIDVYMSGDNTLY